MKRRTCSNLSLVVLLQWSLVASAFSPIYARSSSFSKHSDGYLAAEPDSEVAADKPDLAQNEIYIQGLIINLTTALDRWVVTGSPVKVRTVCFIPRIVMAHATNPCKSSQSKPE